LTRIAGTNIIKASCCRALYSTTAFTSINFMASEHWTDRAAENSLSQSGGGLQRCRCGCYFQSGYAALLEGHDMGDELELGELYREMSRPRDAIFKKWNSVLLLSL
jgi:hypothetical protein